MNEGQVYVCGWRQSPAAGFEAWLKGRLKIRGQGRTFAAAERALLNQIAHRWNDCEAVLEYDPPPPIPPEAKRFLFPELVTVTGNTSPDRFGPEEQLFSKGVCKACGQASGRRTKRPLWIGDAEAGFEAGFTNRPANLRFFSDKFLTLLTLEEKASFELREVECQTSRKRFYELLGKPLAKFVGVKGLDAAGWECAECSYRTFGFWEPNLPIYEFVCRDSLPDPLPSCFLVGDAQESELAFTGTRWRQLVGRPGTRGIVSQPLGVVGASLSVRRPRLRRLYGSPCAVCTRDPWQRPKGGCVWRLPVDARRKTVSQWLLNSLGSDRLVVQRSDATLSDILQMAMKSKGPKDTRILSFRCADCWKLGRVVLDRKELWVDLPHA